MSFLRGGADRVRTEVADAVTALAPLLSLLQKVAMALLNALVCCVALQVRLSVVIAATEGRTRNGNPSLSH